MLTSICPKAAHGYSGAYVRMKRMSPPPTVVTTCSTPSTPRMYSSAGSSARAVASRLVPSGIQNSTKNWARVAAGKNSCWSCPNPMTEPANSAITTRTVAHR